MHEPKIYPVPKEVAARAHMDAAAYEAACIEARDNAETYWT